MSATEEIEAAIEDAARQFARSLRDIVVASMPAPPPEPDSPRELVYTIKETCKVSKNSRTTVHIAITKGDLIATRVGRRVLILASDLEAWLRSKREPPTRRRRSR